jgi:hypothetical protein|tara:strand:- start:550 stop:729 length:180 start_codon:yes stop_codon:yes gene_type:complete
MNLIDHLDEAATRLENVKDYIEEHPEIYSNESWDAVTRTLTKIELIEDLLKREEDGPYV